MIRPSAAAAGIVLITATAAWAQLQRPPVRSVLENYRKGREAVDKKLWEEAIAALTAAVMQDPTDRIYVEGVNRDRYFPHHYLFIAYAETGDLAKARQMYLLRGPLPDDFARQEGPYLARLNPTPTGGTPAAVAERALSPYRAGIEAMKASRWQDAITVFTNAIRFDDKPRATDSADGYFPQYYIAIANLRLRKLDEASASFDRRGAIAKGIYLADEESRFPRSLDFERAAAAGDDAAGKQNPQLAVDNWTRACNALPEECTSRGMRQRIAESQATIARTAAVNEAKQRVASAQSLLGESDLDGARREFQVALARDPGSADAAAGLRDIQARETAYVDSKARAERAAKANDLNTASREYDAALAAHPRWYHERDRLDAPVASINTRRMEAQGIENTARDAQAAFQEGRFDAARQAAQTVLAKNAAYPDMKSIVSRSESRLLFEEGRRIATAGDYYQADAKFKEAVNRDPANAVAQKVLDSSLQYQFLVTQKAFPQAQKVDKARFDRERPDLNFDVVDAIKAANDAFANTDYGSARRKIDEVLQRDSSNISALGLRRRLIAVTAAAKAADAPVAAPVAPAPAAPQPPMPAWMWAALVAVTVSGAGLLLTVRRRTPVPVAVDSLPWGRVTIRQHGKSAKAAPAARTTPFLISLPPGEYELHVASESMSQLYTTKVTIVRGRENKVLVTNPAYDAEEIVSSVLG